MKRREFIKGGVILAGLLSVPIPIFIEPEYIDPLVPVNGMHDELQDLMKALEVGSYNAAPSSLAQGAPLEVESLDVTLEMVKFEDTHLKLWKNYEKN